MRKSTTAGRGRQGPTSFAIPESTRTSSFLDLRTNTVAKFTADQVAFVDGSIWNQRYFTKKKDDYYPLSAQRGIGNKKWLKYHVPDTGADWWTAFYPSDNMQRRY